MTDLNERLLTYNERLFFGQWRLDGATPDEALLGKGSFGRVYAVYREETDSAGTLVRYSAAIKVIPIDDVNLRIRRELDRAQKQKILNDELRYVQREIEMMRRLEGESNIAYFQNSEIIRRTDTELECWDVLICMEKLVVLRKHLQATNLAPLSYPYFMQILHIWREISTALSVCEKSAILHTDVKPDNVFYAPGPDHYKLSDFGTSISGNTFKPGIRYGTNDYMSPEMYHKKGGDSRTDLYSLAVMIYELLNGNSLPLQHGNSREAAWRARLEELKQIPPLKGVPDDVNAVLLRCLDCDPKRRYARCSDVADAVMALYLQYKARGSLGGGKKNRWLIPAVAGVLAAGAIGIGLGVVLGGEKENAPAVEWTQAPTAYAEMTLSADDVAFSVGGDAKIEGWFRLFGDALRAENVVLFADGYGWPVSIAEEDGQYRFSAEMRLTREGEFDLEVSLRTMDDLETALARQIVHFTAVQETAAPTQAPIAEPTPTVEPTLTAEPTAEPTPAPVIELEAETPVFWDAGNVEIGGVISVDAAIRPEALELWVGGEAWEMQIEAQEDGDYAFSARGEVSEPTTGLQLQIRYGDAQSETVGVPVEVIVPTATPVPVLTLALNETEITADSDEITLSGTVTVQGAVSASELLLSVNGSAVEALWDPTDDGIDFSASISMDLEDVDALEIKVRSRASSDIAPATGTISVRRMEATPEPTVEPFSPISIDDLETLNQCWIGANNVLVTAGSAQPGEAIDVTINGRLFGSYAVEEDGSFAVDILSSAWQSGENQISIGYSRAPEGSGDQSVAFSVRFDGDAPVMTAPTTIDQYTEALRVRVEDMDANVRVFAQIDGVTMLDGVRSEEESSDGKAVFDIVLPTDEMQLTALSKIKIVAMDSAGNVARQAVAFQRTLDEITILNAENLISADADMMELRRYINADSGVLRGKATPNTTLRLSVGESAWSLATSEDGAFEWKIDVSAFVEGMNTVAVEYETCDGAPVEAGTGRVEIQIQADGVAPVLNIQPAILMQGMREIQVTVEEASVCCVFLLIDGNYVDDMYELQADRLACESIRNAVEGGAEKQGVNVQKTDGQTCTLTIPEDVELTENSDIVVQAVDGAGNIAVVTLPFEQIAPIEIVNAEELGGNWRNDTDVTIALRGEPGAAVSVVINEDPITAVLDDNGLWEGDITEWLRQGENNITVSYTAENGYPEEVVRSTANATYVSYDTELPKAEVSPMVITRDTTQLTLTAPNEPYGYWYALYADGNAVAGGDTMEESVVIDGIDELNLRKAEHIVLVVGDAINEPVEIELEYQDVSEKVEAYVFLEMSSSSKVNAGETAEVDDLIVLCSDYDMLEGYVTMSLMDESYARRNCTFTRERLSEEEYAQLVEQADANISDYVNSAYRITGVNVPEDCAGGKYTLCMEIEAEHETYSYELNPLTVEESVKGTRVRKPFVDVSAISQYAIGFDEPLQNAFRADNIVLTGGVCQPEGQTMYYNRYEIEDSHHRLLYTSYISGEEFTQVPRAVNDLASLYNESAEEPIVAKTEDAGFVLSIDLSGAGLIDGEEYSLVLYTSNRIDGAWPTLQASILIDSGANEIGEEDVAEITQAWEAELRAAEEFLLAQQLAAEEAAQAADAQQP